MIEQTKSSREAIDPCVVNSTVHLDYSQVGAYNPLLKSQDNLLVRLLRKCRF